MRRCIVTLGILSLLGGCNPDVVNPDRNVPLVPTYNLAGTIRGANNTPLPGARVTLTGVFQNRELETFTDTAGRYQIRGITGTWNIVVKFGDHFDGVSVVVMNSDRVLDFTMVPVVRPLPFEVGKEFAFEIVSNAPPCDPVHWDAGAPCARLRFLAPRTGLLSVLVDWEGPDEVDFTIMSDSEGTYLAYGGGPGNPVSTTYAVTAGTHYVIWVHSYYGPASFKIRADIVP